MNNDSEKIMKTIQDQRDRLSPLKFRVGAIVQKQISDLIFARREFYKRWNFPRSILNWISRGKLCRQNETSWTYEILLDIQNSREYVEIESFKAFSLAKIRLGENAICSVSPESPASACVSNLIRELEIALDE